jgi:hypothetical protein
MTIFFSAFQHDPVLWRGQPLNLSPLRTFPSSSAGRRTLKDKSWGQAISVLIFFYCGKISSDVS